MKNPSYTKKGPGRTHNYEKSNRTLKMKGKRGNKLQRKAKRKHLTLKYI